MMMTTTLEAPFILPPALRLRRLAALFMAAVSGDLAGRREAERMFDELVRTRGSLVASICLSFSRTKEDFEDLRQDALLNIWQGLAGFRGESLPSTWVYRVTLNTCVSFKRKNRVSERQQEAFAEFYRELFDESRADRLARYEQMYRLIARLKPIDKSVLLMWLDDKKYEEIAEVIGLSRDAVAARLKRIRDRLAAEAGREEKCNNQILF